MSFISVDFPEPLGPSMAVLPPDTMVRSTPSRILVLFLSTVMFLNSIMFMVTSFAMSLRDNRLEPKVKQQRKVPQSLLPPAMFPFELCHDLHMVSLRKLVQGHCFAEIICFFQLFYVPGKTRGVAGDVYYGFHRASF